METQSYDSSGAAAGFGIFMIIYLALIVLMIAGMWKTFAKAGKPGWAAIVPIYNIIILLEITGKPIWWIILFLIPIVGFIMYIIVLNQVSVSFGQGVGTTILLLLLPFVGWPMLGFGSAQYQGVSGTTASA